MSLYLKWILIDSVLYDLPFLTNLTFCLLTDVYDHVYLYSWIKIYNLASYISFVPSVLYYSLFLPFLGLLEHILCFYFISSIDLFIPLFISYSCTRVYNIHLQLIGVHLQIYTSSCVKTYNSIFLIPLPSFYFYICYKHKSHCHYFCFRKPIIFWGK